MLGVCLPSLHKKANTSVKHRHHTPYEQLVENGGVGLGVIHSIFGSSVASFLVFGGGRGGGGGKSPNVPREKNNVTFIRDRAPQKHIYFH